MDDPVCYLHLLDDEGRMPVPRVRLQRAYDPLLYGAKDRARNNAVVILEALEDRMSA